VQFSASKFSNDATLQNTHDINVYLCKDRQRAAECLTPTHSSDNSDKGIERFGHKLCIDNFFSSHDVFDDLAQKKKLWDSEAP